MVSWSLEARVSTGPGCAVAQVVVEDEGERDARSLRWPLRRHRAGS